ncbi:MAG TPA: amidohydrolase family protein [Acidimicrobiia bacterium]|nr:amidohydrolase family protein [Acidimicrobiia bacterium]
MTVERVVDAHVHLWDPARADWYPYLAGMQELDMGDISGMCRRFDQSVYFSEAAAWNVQKFVHVGAAAAPVLVEETRELDAEADTTGHPDALIGGLVPSDDTAEIERRLDEHMASKRFRGIRIMGEGDEAIPTPAILQALQDRGLIFELMVHPDQLVPAARALDGWELPVVVEHTGWPRSNDPDEYDLWKTGVAALADLRANVTCKLSGLAMPMQSMDAAAFAPWVHHAIERFGADRCMFASNFPVDAMHGTYDELYGAYDGATAHLDDATRDKLFAANAERLYRC